jgi:hypothetical protein
VRGVEPPYTYFDGVVLKRLKRNCGLLQRDQLGRGRDQAFGFQRLEPFPPIQMGRTSRTRLNDAAGQSSGRGRTLYIRFGRGE